MFNKYGEFLWYSVSSGVLLFIGIVIAILSIALIIAIYKACNLRHKLDENKRRYEISEDQAKKKYMTLAIRYNEAINRYSYIVYSYITSRVGDETAAISKLDEAVKGDYEYLATKKIFSQKDRKIMEAALELTDSQKETILGLMQSMAEKQGK